MIGAGNDGIATLAPAEFNPLTIVRVTRETPHAVSVSLAVPEALRPAFAFRPGQHLHVRAVIDGELVQRTYSICSDPAEPHLRIAVKAIPGGHFSIWASGTLVAGMTLDVGRPQGRFVLPAGDGSPRHLLCLAAGAGITPVIGIVRQVVEAEPESRVTLVYGNRSIDDIIFRQELEDLKDEHLARFTLLHLLSRGEVPDTPLLQGRLDSAKIRDICARLVSPGSIERAFVCGPGSMIKDARDALVGLGLPRERVHYEFFAAGAASARPPATEMPQSGRDPGAEAGQTEIVAVLDGLRHRFTAEPGEPMIEAALRAGVRAPYACKGGMCCTCRARLVEGTAPMRVNYSLEPWEIERGFILTCQAVATSPRVVIDWDAM